MRIIIPPLHQDPVDEGVESNEDKCNAYLSVRIIIPALHQDPTDDGEESNENEYDAYLPLIIVSKVMRIKYKIKNETE